MDKKDIYEHLAKIYLDAPAVKRNKVKTRANDYKNFIVIALAIGLGLGAVVLTRFYLHKYLPQQMSLEFSSEPVKINFDLDPAKKKIFSFDLKKADLSVYKGLGFSVKKSNFEDSVSLRVELTNTFKEKSEIYLKDIPSNWKYLELNFADFKTISDWTAMSGLAFIIEEWNTKENKGVVYIDNVRMFK